MKTFFFFSRCTSALFRGSLAAFVILIAALSWTHPALAQVSVPAVTMGDMFCNMQVEMQWLGRLFGDVAYIVGVFFIGQGLYLLVKYGDNPSSMPLHQPLTRMGGGAALLAAPFVVTSVIVSLFGADAGGGLAVCNPVAPIAAVPGLTGLDVLLNNLIANIQDPLTYLVSCVAIIVGIFMMVNGLIKASRYGMDPREYSMTKIVSNLVIGAILIVVGESSDVLFMTIFGDPLGPKAATDVIAWNFIVTLGLGPASQFVLAVQSAGIFIKLVGLIAFVRGWLILKSASEGSGQATMAQGLTHLIGGVLAINIFGFLELMDATFGTNFL